MLKELKRVILAKASKQHMAALHKHSMELVGHFELTLASFRLETHGKPEHEAMEGYLSTMLENLKITTEFLAEQKNMLEGDAP